MKKFVSQLCNPLEVGTVMNKTISSMQNDKEWFYLCDWALLAYWSVEVKHDMVLLVMEFDNDRDED